MQARAPHHVLLGKESELDVSDVTVFVNTDLEAGIANNRREDLWGLWLCSKQYVIAASAGYMCGISHSVTYKLSCSCQQMLHVTYVGLLLEQLFIVN